MKRLVILPLLLALFAFPASPQSTFLELGLHWGTYSGPAVANVTTVMKNSHGTVVAKIVDNAFPHITIPVALDIYTITITAPASSTTPGLNWSFTMPMGTAVASMTVNNYTAAIAIDSTGTHGTVKASILATF